MAEVKFSQDLFIGKNELERFKLFLDKNGWRQHFIQMMLTPGVIKNKYIDASFQNGKVEVEDLVNFKIRIQQLKAVDKDGQFIYLNDIKKITIPFQDLWYWVKCSYISTSIEKGTFSLDTQGNLTGVSSELTKILRGYPNFQQRIKFTNATLNTGEYDIIEVTSDTSAVLQGSNFQAETNLQLSVVGTFTPGVVISTQNKFPFIYDSAIVELVQESTPNTPPSKVIGSEFYLARVRARITGGVTYIIDIQDKRTEILLDNDIYKQIQLLANPAVGIEQIRWQNDYSNKNLNDVRVGWGVKGNTWSVDATLNEVFLSNADGGLIKDVSSIISGQFNGWRLYSPKGTYGVIQSTTPSGGGVKCRLDYLNIDDFSSDGGTTLYSQPVLITPDAEEIEFSFKENGQPNEFRYRFNINEIYGTCPVQINSSSSTVYTVQYRYRNVADYTQFVNIPNDGTNGYYAEDQFDATGSLIISPTRTTYTGAQITLLTSTNGVFSAALIALLLGLGEPVLLNGFAVVDNVTTVDITAGTAFINGKIVQVNSYSGSYPIYLNSSGQYVVSLPAGQSILFDPYTSQYFDDVIKRHTTKAYEVIQLEQVEATFFTGTGLGKWKWKGFAKCNGQNSTIDRQEFIMIGSSANTGFQIGQSGGGKTHTIVQANLPNINLATETLYHGKRGTGNDPDDNIAAPGSPNSGGAFTISVPLGGSGTAINHLNPYKPVVYLQRMP